ncbi:MAG: hypothetical protein ACK5P7_04145 [Bdellovibrio sp.]
MRDNNGMIPGRKTPHPEESRSLVAEQPGLFWSLAGTLTVLFVGLAFRATFSSEKITALVHQAAGQVHKDVKIEFASAALSLSDGLFPELAVVINNVRASVDLPCQMSPELNVDQVRLPLEIMELIRGRVRLATVEIGHSDLVLQEIPESCARAPAIETSASPAPAPSSAKGTQKAPLEVAAEKRNPVENILIKSVRVQAPNERLSGLEIRRVRVNARPELKTLQAKGTLILPTESLAGDYGSSADFTIDYRDLPEPFLELRAQGTWREGTYRLKAESEVQKRTSKIDFKAEHLPLSPLVTLLHRENGVTADLSGKQAWISFHLSTAEGEAQPLGPLMRLNLKDLKLEGDLGEIESDKISFEQVSPLKMKPFKIGLRGVRLEKIFSFLQIPIQTPILGELGSFNGLLSYQDDKHYELAGENSGLQFVFSNRGSREIQTLSLIGGKAIFRNEEWSVLIDRIRPLEGLFLGSVKVKADRYWKSVHAVLDIDEMSLQPNVQKLMTGGGSLGAWSGEIDGVLQSGTVQKLKGHLLVTDLVIENLEVARANLSVTSNPSRADAFIFEFVGKRLKLRRPSPLLETLNPFLGVSEQTYESDQLRLQLESKDFQVLKWKMPAIKVGSASLRSEGGWNEKGELSGDIVRLQQGTETRWELKGTRALPGYEQGHTK